MKSSYQLSPSDNQQFKKSILTNKLFSPTNKKKSQTKSITLDSLKVMP